MQGLNHQTDVKLQSSYLEYLPALYRDDEFMGQFLLILESIMKPIENTVDNLPLHFDPLLTPEPLLPWLAYWLDLTLDPGWPMERRRELVKSAAELYRWRGTRRGLAEYLRIYTGSIPEISEYIPGMRLEDETKLGINTKLGSSGAGHHFTVSLELDGNHGININTVKSIIEAQKTSPHHLHPTGKTEGPGQIWIAVERYGVNPGNYPRFGLQVETCPQ
ncbi:phage tail protein [Chloroflexota bacterium]